MDFESGTSNEELEVKREIALDALETAILNQRKAEADLKKKPNDEEAKMNLASANKSVTEWSRLYEKYKEEFLKRGMKLPVPPPPPQPKPKSK